MSSFRVTPAATSRIKKPKKPSPFKRSTAGTSPYSALARRKPLAPPRSKDTDDDEEYFGDRLEDLGLVQALATDLELRDVPQAMRYITARMFTTLPDRATGMSSTRIADVLNFRRSLPPIVTVAHVKALLTSPTAVEREIVELVEAGTLRKIIIPGRGGVGEALILASQLEAMIHARADLDPATRDRFVAVLRAHRASARIPTSAMSDADAAALMQAGFLTAASASWNTTDAYSQPGDGARGTLTSIHSIARAASGSLAAVGGEGAVHAAGGSGGHLHARPAGLELALAIPSTGPYLKLLTHARAHLMALLSKLKYREAPQSLLRERWDGAIAGDDAAATARKARGEFAGVLPGRTRKWKQFYGVSFEWILGEAVGAGMVEVFNTRAVGLGVRAC